MWNWIYDLLNSDILAVILPALLLMPTAGYAGYKLRRHRTLLLIGGILTLVLMVFGMIVSMPKEPISLLFSWNSLLLMMLCSILDYRLVLAGIWKAMEDEETARLLATRRTLPVSKRVLLVLEENFDVDLQRIDVNTHLSWVFDRRGEVRRLLARLVESLRKEFELENDQLTRNKTDGWEHVSDIVRDLESLVMKNIQREVC